MFGRLGLQVHIDLADQRAQVTAKLRSVHLTSQLTRTLKGAGTPLRGARYLHVMIQSESIPDGYKAIRGRCICITTIYLRL